MRVISNHQYKILLEIQPFKLMIMKKLSVVCLCFLLVNITTAQVVVESSGNVGVGISVPENDLIRSMFAVNSLGSLNACSYIGATNFDKALEIRRSGTSSGNYSNEYMANIMCFNTLMERQKTLGYMYQHFLILP